MSTAQPIESLSFYATPPHRCSYLPNQNAVTLFADPLLPKGSEVYSILSQHGFRRSGENLYRPACPRCKACVPVRVRVNMFVPRRNQRRTWRQNQDLDIRAVPARYDPEHLALYHRYLTSRHPGGGMDNPSVESFKGFLISAWSQTVFYEMRLRGRLIAVAVADVLNDGLSAVYTFFDPAFSRRSLGRFAILIEIVEAQRQRLPWLYLGYWIRQSEKMRYKDEYQPLEYFQNGEWASFHAIAHDKRN